MLDILKQVTARLNLFMLYEMEDWFLVQFVLANFTEPRNFVILGSMIFFFDSNVSEILAIFFFIADLKLSKYS